MNIDMIRGKIRKKKMTIIIIITMKRVALIVRNMKITPSDSADKITKGVWLYNSTTTIVGVERFRTSSTTSSMSLTSTARPSGAWVAVTCFITALSSEDENMRRSLLSNCIFWFPAIACTKWRQTRNFKRREEKGWCGLQRWMLGCMRAGL